MSYVEIAILAPVPKEHLASGQGIAASTGYVCFGSDLFELFREVDKQRQGEEVPVFLYASHNEELSDWGYVIAWRGTYIGSVEDSNGKRAEELAGHRPPTTAQYAGDDAWGWGVFWMVKDLQQIPVSQRRELRDVQSFRTGKSRKNSAPRGPEIIKAPPWL